MNNLNIRYNLRSEFEAESIAEDLRLQLDINRFNQVSIESVSQDNQVIIKLPEEHGDMLEVINQFMHNYQVEE